LPGDLVRHYSLAVSDEHPQSYVIAVKRDAASRGGSLHLHDEARIGDRFKVLPPRNNFPLNEQARHSIFFAGGIGITPIWSMAQRMAKLGRAFELHYACRSRNDAAFLDELTKLGDVRLHVDEECGGKPIDLVAAVAAAPAHAHLYCCGPLPMLAAFEEATAAWPAEQRHVEYFTAKHDVARDGEFSVVLARSGLTLQVKPGETILEVVRRAGIAAPSSCELGICGSCETAVLQGVPDHRDSLLSESERAAGDMMMICCSGSKTPELVLDI
jgi:ferredoxin-NADP reductase